MLNIVTLAGRIVNDIDLRKSSNDKDYTYITLAVNRTFKNSEGVYETDFIDCIVWNKAVQNIKEYCHKGDMVAVKGCLRQIKKIENEKTKSYLQVEADRIIFLSSKKSEVKDNDLPEEKCPW